MLIPEENRHLLAPTVDAPPCDSHKPQQNRAARGNEEVVGAHLMANAASRFHTRSELATVGGELPSSGLSRFLPVLIFPFLLSTLFPFLSIVNNM